MAPHSEVRSAEIVLAPEAAQGQFRRSQERAGGASCVIFSERDVDLLRLVYWCQYVRAEDMKHLATETELSNLTALGLIRPHEKSGALIITNAGQSFLVSVYGEKIPALAFSYHAHIIQRRLRLSALMLTAYQSHTNIFNANQE